MIYTGIDIIEIERVRGVLERYPQRFKDKIFTEQEKRFAKNRVPQLAARFAAKEAVMKALGTGIRGVPWKSVEVFRMPGQAPEIILHEPALSISRRRGITRIAVTLSHSKEFAVASVVAEAREGEPLR